MDKELIFIVLHFMVCVAFFLIIQRPLFCIYNRALNTSTMRIRDWWKIYRHGYKTDLKVAAYLTMFPLLIVWVHAHFPIFNSYPALLACDAVLALSVALATVADTVLYKFWQFKIDSSVFAYLKSLKGAFASVSATYILTAVAAVLLVSGIFFAALMPTLRMCNREAASSLPGWSNQGITFVIFVITATVLFLITRGVKRRPENPSITYFSKNQFYNHSALNPLFNLIYSFSVKDDFGKQFQAFPPTECQRKFESLFPLKGTPEIKLLNTTRPNILLIVWEGLCTHFIESLGGVPNVAVNFDRLSKEGVLFTHCYAGSFRTDRGLVCLLSGYLGQPTTSVIRYTRKLPHLPALPRILRDKAGYSTMALHGGDLTIFHKSDYYLASGHDRLIYQKDFPTSAPACSWGIHDGYLFSWLYDNIQKKTEANTRWYTTFQTLSSHEPFEVPYDRIKTDKVENSFAYVDDCFGKFVDKLKNSPAWDDLLIICTGDHGVNLDYLFTQNEKTHIPMLLLGGAVKQPMQIDKIINQTDLAATLLGQMELPHEDFIFSRDVMADTYTYPFAFHTYNNGFIFRDGSGVTHFDNVSGQALKGANPRREELGKVILQTLYTDLSKR